MRSSNALTPETAVDLPYAGKNLLRIGLRDHRKMALNHLVLQQVVGQRYEERYYPHAAGVAQSHNYYPVPPQTSDCGVVSLVLGLGQLAVGQA